ncbi:MAG: NUDIX domain-containing protein [archaeon]
MNLTHPRDEYLDLVDANDKVIGKRKRSEIIAENLSCFRVVNAFIVNSRNEIWIPRRTPDKIIFPSCLDMSMGGHVKSGETYEDALEREMREELKINVGKVPHRLLGYLTPRKNKVSSFMKVYEIRTDRAPDYNKSDFVEYFWLTPKALFDRIRNGEKTKEDLPKLVKTFYGEK